MRTGKEQCSWVWWILLKKTKMVFLWHVEQCLWLVQTKNFVSRCCILPLLGEILSKNMYCTSFHCFLLCKFTLNKCISRSFWTELIRKCMFTVFMCCPIQSKSSSGFIQHVQWFYNCWDHWNGIFWNLVWAGLWLFLNFREILESAPS